MRFGNTATQEWMTSRLFTDVRQCVAAGIVVPFAIMTVHVGTSFMTNVVRFSVAPVYEIHRWVVCPDEWTIFTKVSQCNHKILTRRSQQCLCNECILAGRVDGQQTGSQIVTTGFSLVPGFFDGENLVTRVVMVMPALSDVTCCNCKWNESHMVQSWEFCKSWRHTETHWTLAISKDTGATEAAYNQDSDHMPQFSRLFGDYSVPVFLAFQFSSSILLIL